MAITELQLSDGTPATMHMKVRYGCHVGRIVAWVGDLEDGRGDICIVEHHDGCEEYPVNKLKKG